MFQINGYVPIEAIGEDFKSACSVLEKGLGQINASQAALLCIKLNLLTSTVGSNKPELQMQSLKLLLNAKAIEPAIAEMIRKHLEQQARQGYLDFAFNRPGLLETIRWISILGNHDCKADMTGAKHLRKIFARAIFCGAELYGQREIAPTLNNDVPRSENERTFLKGMRRAAAWGHADFDALIALGRASLLVGDEFLQVFPEYKQKFQSLYSFSFDEWLTFHAAIIMVGLDPKGLAVKADSLTDLYEWREAAVFRDAPHVAPAFYKFLDSFGQTLADLKVGFGNCKLNGEQNFAWKHLRTKPILRFGDGRGIVIDRRLFVESLVNGPIFALGAGEDSYTHLQRLGEAFQNYAHKLLVATDEAQLAENRSDHILNEPGGTPMPIGDILAGKQQACLLIEAKAVWLPDSLLTEEDDEEFLNAVLKKYCQAASPGTPAKGFGQLANVIKALANKELEVSVEAGFINGCNEIFPILLAQDALISDPLMSRTLTRKFCELMGCELNESGFFQHGSYKVHNAFILTGTDLERMNCVVCNGSLFDLLREYSGAHPDRMFTFGQFFSSKENLFTPRPANQQLVRARAIEVASNIGKHCFGDEFPQSEEA